MKSNVLVKEAGMKLRSMVRLIGTRTPIAGVNKELNLDESQYVSQFIVNANSNGFTFDDDDSIIVTGIIKSIVASMATFCGFNKITDSTQAVAVVLNDMAGNFKLGAIIQYNDDTEEGNWNYSMTFSEDVLNAISKTRTIKKYLISDDSFKSVFDKVSHNIGIQLVYDKYLFDACNIAVDTLTGVLDNIAKEDDKMEIVVPGYFKASVDFEDGEKVMGIVPEGQMKELVKGDLTLDKMVSEF